MEVQSASPAPPRTGFLLARKSQQGPVWWRVLEESLSGFLKFTIKQPAVYHRVRDVWKSLKSPVSGLVIGVLNMQIVNAYCGEADNHCFYSHFTVLL